MNVAADGETAAIDRETAGLLARLGAADDFASFVETAFEVISEVLPSDAVGYNEIHERGEARGMVAPQEAAAAVVPLFEHFERHMHQSPLIAAYNAGATGALRWDDACDVAQFRRTELYRLFYEPLGVRHQMAIPVPSPEGATCAFALNRTHPFTDDELAIANRLRGPLALVHGHRRPLVDAVGGVLDDRRWTSMYLSSGGAVFAASGPHQYGIIGGARLPEPLRRWVAASLDAGGETIAAHVDDGAAVQVRLVGLTSGERVVLVRPLELAIPDERLTGRQREVMAELLAGGTNQDIARRLGISPETVKKHLTAAYRALDVADRASAIAALRAATHVDAVRP
ncbi:MAG: LuxR C-terminal-related transcriptional regulator [Actinomycetota bacterium]|nr:LuxR C-terminal-related transcriptional regulator [Actinomycetota bacterium]